MIPRAIVVVGVLVGVFGLGAYLKSDPASRFTTRQAVTSVGKVSAKTTDTPSESTDMTAPADPGQPQLRAMAEKPAGSPVKVVADEQYFCGAETKKGTPCSRRVKGNVRCYQHAGMPAMASAAKLRIK